MTLHLYNTFTRRVEPFEPLEPGRVKMYVCGPTVYDDPHIGHARSAYVFDVLRRYLQYRGFTVRFIRNITDVDDKIIQKTLETGEPAEAVTQRYGQSYHAMLERLGIQPPDVEPRATGHIDDMVELIAQLVAKDMAYAAQGDVYFAVRKFGPYGRLSHRALDDLQAGARVEPGEHKRDPLDFALWKAAKPDEPSWPSPWGPGRPGWHIECSAMSTKYLGDAFDIHGGGLDLIFPHHENEIAQAQAAGKPFARYWIHNGLLTINGQKMSKSLGNFISVEQVLESYPHPDYLKLFFLKTHYRSPIDYMPERMEETKKNWETFSSFFQHYDQVFANQQPTQSDDEEPGDRDAFDEAMDDDLNTSKALAILFTIARNGHAMLESGDRRQRSFARTVYDNLIECGGVLGLFRQGLSEESLETLQRLRVRIAEREAARKAKNFARADEIRRDLQQEGILLTDTASDTLWRRKR